MDVAIFDALDAKTLRRARKRLRRLMRRGPVKLQAMARSKSRAAAEASAGQIRAHPLGAAAVLFGAGLATGAVAAAIARR